MVDIVLNAWYIKDSNKPRQTAGGEPTMNRKEVQNMTELKTYTLHRYSQKTGDVDTTLEGISKAMLAMWALQNTTPSKASVITDETGLIYERYTGRKDNFPKIERHLEGGGEYVELTEY